MLLLRFVLDLESLGATEPQFLEFRAEARRLGIVEMRFHCQPPPDLRVQGLLLSESSLLPRSYFQALPLGLRLRSRDFLPPQSLRLPKLHLHALLVLPAAPFLCCGIGALVCFDECCFRFGAATVFFLLNYTYMRNFSLKRRNSHPHHAAVVSAPNYVQPLKKRNNLVTATLL